MTLRFRDRLDSEIKLKDLGSNHREILLALNNEDGNLPLLTKEKEAKFEMPIEMLWKHGLSIFSIEYIQPWIGQWILVQAFCHQLLSNKTLHEELKNEHFDVTIIGIRNIPQKKV